jgi:hypothetical protein
LTKSHQTSTPIRLHVFTCYTKKNFKLIDIFDFSPHCPSWPGVPEYSSLPYVCESGDSVSGKIVVNSDVKSTHEKVKQNLSLVVGKYNSYNVGQVAIALWYQHGNRSDHEDCHNGCCYYCTVVLMLQNTNEIQIF